MRLGLNHAHNSYFDGNAPWLNMLRPASDWLAVKISSPFTFDWGPGNGGPNINLDANGGPTLLEADQYLQCALKQQNAGRPDYSVAGRRLILYYTGTGAWTLLGGGATYALISNDTVSNPKRAVLSLNAPSNSTPVYFRLTSVNAGDPIQLHGESNGVGLGLIPEEHEARWLAGERYHPGFVSMIAPFQWLRFLNWGAVNDSTQVDWADRRPYAWRSQRSQGGWTNSNLFAPLGMTSYEEMIELCNFTGKDAWVCIPHEATDDYVTQLATLFRDELDASLKVRFEYTNEAWNSIFDQYDYTETQGLVIWPEQAATPWVAAQRWYAYRSGQVADLISAVFTGADAARVVRVAAWQSTNSSNAATLLDFTDATVTTPLKDQIDEIAHAPYIGGDMGNNPQATVTTAPYDKAVQSMAATEVIGWLLGAGSRSISAVRADIAAYRAVAVARGLTHSFYECGQHLVNGAGLSGNTTLTTLFTAVNDHALMETVVREYLLMADEYLADEAVAAWLSDTYIPSATGNWGFRKHQNQTPTPPKELGILGYVDTATGGGATAVAAHLERIGITRRRRK